jgi:N-acetyl-anhydromuramyl-L-alanine amidase AmpD
MIISNIVHKLTVHAQKQYGTRKISDIDKIIVHHSATNSGTPDSFADYHVQRKDWPGIGYHAVIDADANIYLTNNSTTISYNCSGQNATSIGICLIGNFEKTEPTTEQINALIHIIKFYNELTEKTLSIYGHCDFRKTSCCGRNLYAKLEQVREQIKKK